MHNCKLHSSQDSEDTFAHRLTSGPGCEKANRKHAMKYKTAQHSPRCHRMPLSHRYPVPAAGHTVTKWPSGRAGRNSASHGHTGRKRSPVDAPDRAGTVRQRQPGGTNQETEPKRSHKRSQERSRNTTPPEQPSMAQHTYTDGDSDTIR